MADTDKTTGQYAEEESRHPQQVRRAADAVAARLGVTLPRVGGYRLIRAELIPLVEAELRRRDLITGRAK